MYSLGDTICAISTPRGTGGIAAIRISGIDSWSIAASFFSLSKNSFKSISIFQHMQAEHGYLFDDGKMLDEVIVLPYKAPNSFTAEDVIEIFCHGGMQITSMVLDLCLANGARLAQNGEFTFRAFINGRIDLIEAEAINDLIHADSQKAVISSTSVLLGSVKNKVLSFKDKLISILAQIESSIEFPVDVDSVDKEVIKNLLLEVKDEINDLIHKSKDGQVLRTGIKVSIVGLPNVGKSSLLNQLLESDRAIVTDVPGTTRDTLEEKILIDGFPFVFVDTAGIRELAEINNPEYLGIEKSKKEIEKADIVLVVSDLTNKEKLDLNLLNQLKTKIMVGNKLDLTTENFIDSSNFDVCVSARESINIDKLKTILVEKTKNNILKSTSTSEAFINERQKELLIQTNNSIQFICENVLSGIPDDIIADELKKAVSKLDEISGADVSEKVLSEIFTKFCIGK